MKLLRWALIAFVISIVAAGLGFTGIASGARTIAKLLFGVFLALAIVIVLIAVLIGQAVF